MIFGGRTGTLKKANHRMVTRLSSPELWTMWKRMPTTVILPDEGDAERFYAMPTFRYGGIYFGFLHHLQQKPAYELMPRLVGAEMCIRDRKLTNSPRASS